MFLCKVWLWSCCIVQAAWALITWPWLLQPLLRWGLELGNMFFQILPDQIARQDLTVLQATGFASISLGFLLLLILLSCMWDVGPNPVLMLALASNNPHQFYVSLLLSKAREKMGGKLWVLSLSLSHWNQMERLSSTRGASDSGTEQSPTASWFCHSLILSLGATCMYASVQERWTDKILIPHEDCD